MKPRNKVKFLQQMDKNMMRAVEHEAKKRGITKQQMIRAVMIPEWLAHQK